MSLPIYITHTAKADLDSILDYIQFDLCNEKAAEDLLEAFNHSLSVIRDHPESNRIAPEKALQKRMVRKHVFRNYIIFYRVYDTRIRILRVQSALVDFTSARFMNMLMGTLSDEGE